MKSENIVAIGSRAFEIEPLTLEEHNRVSKDILQVLDDLGKATGFNGRCPTVGNLVAEAIWKSGKIPEWIEMMTGVPRAEVRAKVTRPQLLHFVGVFWRVNLFDRIENAPSDPKILLS